VPSEISGHKKRAQIIEFGPGSLEEAVRKLLAATAVAGNLRLGC